MVAINLLPWRQQQRQRRKHHLQLMLGASVILGGALAWLGGAIVGHLHDGQLQRNQLLQQQIAIVDMRNQQVAELSKQFESIQQQGSLIAQLHDTSLNGVRLFNELHQVVGKGVQLKRLSLQQNELTIEGFCHSNNEITDMLRAIEGAAWLHSPSLESIVAEEQLGRRGHRFRMKLQLGNEGGKDDA